MEGEIQDLAPTEHEQPQMQARAETSRSLDDSEKFQAVETLKELGLFTPLEQVEAHHGRLGKRSDEWKVNPTLSNAGNDTGNYNINKRPTLYTADEINARLFAEERHKSAVFPQYLDLITQRVKDYTPEQRTKLLQLLNSDQNKINSNKRPFIDRDLDNPSVIRKEALRIESSLSNEEKQSLLVQASDEFESQTHRILSQNPDAMLVDASFNWSKLNSEDQKKFSQALSKLSIPVTEGSPVDFADRDKIEKISKALQARMLQDQTSIISSQQIKDISNTLGWDEKTVLQIGSAFNARYYTHVNPAILVNRFVSNPQGVFVEQMKDGEKTIQVPLNMEYVARYFRKNHIVGVIQEINSVTIDKTLTSYSFFDLTQIGTEQQLKQQRQEILQRTIGLTDKLPEITGFEGPEEARALRGSLEDLHVKPQRLVENAKKIDGYDKIFAESTGTWEGFTIAEHTETVLRNFDENFADELPYQYLGPLRLAILAHDLGKAEAVENNEKHRQKDYNLMQANDFFNRIGIDSKFQALLLGIIGDGAELSHRILVKKDESAISQMRDLAIRTLRQFLGTTEISEDQIASFGRMCEILQTCDGGSYTSMATTRTEGKGTYRNAPSFNRSFASPAAIDKRDIKYKKDDEPPAPNNLTPMN